MNRKLKSVDYKEKKNELFPLSFCFLSFTVCVCSVCVCYVYESVHAHSHMCVNLKAQSQDFKSMYRSF